MNKLKSSVYEVSILIVGEILVSLLVIGGYFLFGPFDETSFTSMVIGVSVGSAVIIVNYLLLILTVNHQINNYLSLRGSREMTPEEILTFTTEHSMKIQNAIKLSFLVRLLTMVGALVAAFVFIDFINPIATVIPILAYRFILTLGELIRKKFNKQPNPENFILYNTEADGYEEITEDTEADVLAEDTETDALAEGSDDTEAEDTEADALAGDTEAAALAEGSEELSSTYENDANYSQKEADQ